ncbi:MAG: group II intron reverse transcriptase/maturase [Tannerella sp.]|jgi:group II intron reverse transcriptase/maturase|nr:group II intron reverse transcriptase/maturase [Tannerella sp.]
MQNISTLSDSYLEKDRPESEVYQGVQTFVGITENSLTEVHFTREDLLERILSSANLNKAYKRVLSNKGSGGVDGLQTSELREWLLLHKEELLCSIAAGRYRPNPVRRAETVQSGGKIRSPGIPTVVDRLIQQSIVQVLSPIYDRDFSATSYGFRPHRSCHAALKQAQSYVTSGYQYVVDLDIEKFFDTVSHSRLMELLSRRVKDGRVISLIHKYLLAGVQIGERYESSSAGVPQGSPLSPLLSNIMLNELDKELERRGHRFVRYADDCLILCRSKRSAERTMVSIIRFIEEKLYLRVNKEKTKTGYVRGMKFLGYSFYVKSGKCRLPVHPKSYTRFKHTLKSLTGRSNGMGYEKRKSCLRLFITGWLEYFKLADMKSKLQKLDAWYHRRVRMCIWKCWKKVKTRFKNLMRCGIDKRKAWEWANTRKGYWHISNSFILSRALNNDNLRRAGYPFLMDCYRKVVS